MAITLRNRPELSALIKATIERVDAMTPEELEAVLGAQRESWARGEMELAESVKGRKHRMPDGSIRYDDYEAYCFD